MMGIIKDKSSDSCIKIDKKLYKFSKKNKFIYTIIMPDFDTLLFTAVKYGIVVFTYEIKLKDNGTPVLPIFLIAYIIKKHIKYKLSYLDPEYDKKNEIYYGS